jgi:hypothetical protein
MKIKCSSCTVEFEFKGKRYCLSCHARYMREWRKKHSLTDEQRKKDNCRSYASTYLKRGKISKQDCEICGSPDSQMHHDDYDQPLNVRGLCRKCHLDWHKLGLTKVAL